MEKSSKGKVWIYHELQESLLCGQHCLNNLLQGPYFTAPDLAAIAQELDDIERRHMLEGGVDNPEALKFFAESSGNVDDSGNFSLQVLSRALSTFHNINLVNWKSKEAQELIKFKPTINGYIVNRSNHWFSIRRVDGTWWNVNSTQDVPTQISAFHLDVFLGQLVADNYSVFIAEGKLPTYGNEVGEDMGGSGKWHLAADLLENRTGTQQAPALPKFAGAAHRLGGGGAAPTHMEGTDEEQQMLAEAIRLSMMDVGVGVANPALAAQSSRAAAAPLSKKDEMRALRLAALEKRSKGDP